MLTVCYIIAVDVMAGKSCNDLEQPETSSVTVKNGCSEAGGYDCDFVESQQMICCVRYVTFLLVILSKLTCVVDKSFVLYVLANT